MVSEVNHVGYYRNICSLSRMSNWINLWCFVSRLTVFRFTFSMAFAKMATTLLPPDVTSSPWGGENEREKIYGGEKSKRRRKIGTEAKKLKRRGKNPWRGKIPGGEKMEWKNPWRGKIGEEKTDIRSLEGKNPRRGKFC